MPTISAAIFDMDGVLVDSEPLHLVSTNEVLGRQGVKLTEEENRPYLGWNEPSYWAALTERFQLEGDIDALIRERHESLVAWLRKELPVAEGIDDFLRDLGRHGLPLAVASSSERTLIDFILGEGRLRKHFAVVASGDEVERSKPDPEIFLLAAERLGKMPRECLVFEDSVNGALAAGAAGMSCVRVITESTRCLEFPEVDGVIESFVGLDADDVMELVGSAR